DELQRLVHALDDVRLRHPHPPQPHGDVVEYGHRVEQRGELEHVSDTPAQLVQLVAIHCRDILAVDVDDARIRLEQTNNALQQHRLADAGVTDDGECLAFVHGQRHVIQDDAAAERLPHIAQLDTHSSTTAQNASSTRISMLLTTTAWVVERPTAAAPPIVLYP